jgi:hypothetical protein
MGPAGTQDVEADPRDHRGQPAAQVAHVVRAGTAQPEPGILHGVVRLGQGAQHLVRHRVQVRPVLLELVGQKFLALHRHLRSAESVMGHDERPPVNVTVSEVPPCQPS